MVYLDFVEQCPKLYSGYDLKNRNPMDNPDRLLQFPKWYLDCYLWLNNACVF